MFSLSVNRRCNGGGSEALLCKYINLANCISYKSASLGIFREFRILNIRGNCELTMSISYIIIYYHMGVFVSDLVSARSSPYRPEPPCMYCDLY